MSYESKKFLEFTNYLLNFGFLSGSNIQDFKEIFKSLNNYRKSFNNKFDPNTKYLNLLFLKDNISLCIVNFLNLMSDDKKKLLGMNLFTKFMENEENYKINLNNNENKKKNILFKIFSLYQKFSSRKILKKYFSNWKTIKNKLIKNIENYNNNKFKKITNNNNKNYLKSFQRNQSFNKNLNNNYILNDYFNKTNFIKNKQYRTNNNDNFFDTKLNNFLTNSIQSKSDKKSSSNKKNKNELSTEFLKEKEDLKNCTFHPNINNNNNLSYIFKNNNIDNFLNNFDWSNRLYLDSQKRNLKKDLNELKKSSLDSNDNPFKPTLISTSPKNFVYYNFNENLKKFSQNKSNNLKKISNEMENNFNEKFTFQPNIKISQKKHLSPTMSKKLNEKVYNRLYNNLFERDKKFNEMQNKYSQEIKNLANSKSSKNLNNNYNSIDYNKIEQLYKEFHKFEENKEKMRKELDIEHGLTFKPEIKKNKYHNRINTNFQEREQIFLNEKERFINENKNMFNEQFNANKKKYSSEQKEEIKNDIINRLYKDGVQKYITRKQQQDLYEREYKNYKKNGVYNSNNYY